MESYAAARKHFDATKPWRGSSDRPIKERRFKNRRMRELPDGSIEFEYINQPFARWHPDETLSVKAWSQQVNSPPIRQVLPNLIYMPNPAIRGGNVVYMMHESITDKRGHTQWWVEDTSKPKNGWGGRPLFRNPALKKGFVVRADNWVRLTESKDGQWLPVEQEGLKPFQWRELDKKAARETAGLENLRDFVACVDAMDKLVEVDESLSWRRGWYNTGQLLALVNNREFAEAYKLLPRKGNWTWNAGSRQYVDLGASRAPINALRTRLYAEAGDVLVERSAKILTIPEYQRVVGLLKRFG